MKKDLQLRTHPLVASLLIVAATFVLLFSLFGLNRWVSQGQVLGKVEVAGVPLGGLTEAEARTAILDIQQLHQARQINFNIDGQPVRLVGAETGFTLDVADLLGRAMAMGREGNSAYQFLWWFTRIFKTEEIGLTGSTDPTAMESIFDDWDERVLANPGHHGTVEVIEGQLVAVHPRTGTAIDRSLARRAVEQNLLAREPVMASIPTSVIIPRLTAGDIDRALEEAKTLTSKPISLVNGESGVTLSPTQLVEAYVATTVLDDAPRVEHRFDPGVIDTFLTPVRAQYESAPVNARFRIEGDQISIIRGRRGTRIDETVAAEELLRVAGAGGQRGDLPIVEHSDPQVTTADLENMGIRHLVSSFTTYYDCCQARVTNIRLMADEVSMAVIPPNGTFDLNAYVGPRTEAKGYLPAPTIIQFQLVDTIGGGVSQFATTLYNAVFWGGYEDIDHRPHTQWFSRYPEGIEATVNWGGPELIFRNNTDKHILIHTLHSGTSVTVRIFGDNDGRIVKGEQRGGVTRMNVVAAGGPNARHIEANVSERFNILEPQPPIYEADASYAVGQMTTKQSERIGWSVTVSRRITRGGEQVGYREWLVRYVPQRAIYVVHPCMVPGQEHTCPTTTTTTTTTTIPDEDEGG